MRIGIYDPYLDDLGGGEKYMMSMAFMLTDKYDVDVFWDNQEDFHKLHARFDIDFAKIKRVENIFKPTVSLANRFLTTKKYDVIIFLSDGSIPLVGSKKLLLHIQQPLEHMQLYSLWNRFKWGRVKKFFVNSDYTKEYIQKKFHISPTVVYPPVFLSPKKTTKQNSILHVGRFRLQDPLTHADDFKKQHTMLLAFKQMVDSGLKNWKFVLAVSVNEKEVSAFEEMKKSVKDYPVEFYVNKSNKQLWDLYSKAKIYWHASGYGEDLQKHPEFAEHFGISTVEAMGAGVVPVVINAGGQREIVEDGTNGLLWNSLEELKEKTLQLTQDTKLLQKLSTAAKKRAQDFSFEKFSLAVHNLVI